MKIYYAMWNGKEHIFDEPVTYNFTLPIEFPNLVLRAREFCRHANREQNQHAAHPAFSFLENEIYQVEHFLDIERFSVIIKCLTIRIVEEGMKKNFLSLKR